jgi:hypothetical protein
LYLNQASTASPLSNKLTKTVREYRHQRRCKAHRMGRASARFMSLSKPTTRAATGDVTLHDLVLNALRPMR